MKCRHIGPNTVEIEAGEVAVLFSYATPVAVHIAGEGYYRTSERHSVNTSRHINGWLCGAKATERPQEYFNSMRLLDPRAAS